MNALLVLDTLDDRREIHHLLAKLPPRRRIAFLDWCTRQVKNDKGDTPHPIFDQRQLELAMRCDRADLRLTNEVYSDLWILVGQWRLDPVLMADTLESWVRRVESV